MTLPSSYNTSRDYLSDSLNFLKSFSWLYNYHNTYIIAKKILTHFPYEWVLYFKKLSYEDLHKLLESNTEVSGLLEIIRISINCKTKHYKIVINI